MRSLNSAYVCTFLWGGNRRRGVRPASKRFDGATNLMKGVEQGNEQVGAQSHANGLGQDLLIFAARVSAESAVRKFAGLPA